MNGITAFVEASNVYGSDDEKAMSLRTGAGGKLLESDGAKLTLIDREYTDRDIRARDNSGLTSLHTVFLRKHNSIAAELKTRESSLSDEELYQRARRLLGAQYQNIVYTEFLPTVLGKEAMTKYNLKLDTPSNYNPNTDPSITNVFATAAYRFGHSQIPDLVQMIHDVQRSYKMSEHFFNSTFYDQYMDAILEGMITQKTEATDVNVAEAVTEKLFTDFGGPGSDLIARNIQRGRDHGLPGYNEWREKCFGAASRVCSWEDPPSNIPRLLWDKLYELYDSPSDIDLFSAGLAEDKVTGGQVGATFACIIGKQFEALKDGDRFFFNHKEIPFPFTTVQECILPNFDPYPNLSVVSV
jgi:peroxidase